METNVRKDQAQPKRPGIAVGSFPPWYRPPDAHAMNGVTAAVTPSAAGGASMPHRSGRARAGGTLADA